MNSLDSLTLSRRLQEAREFVGDEGMSLGTPVGVGRQINRFSLLDRLLKPDGEVYTWDRHRTAKQPLSSRSESCIPKYEYNYAEAVGGKARARNGLSVLYEPVGGTISAIEAIGTDE